MWPPLVSLVLCILLLGSSNPCSCNEKATRGRIKFAYDSSLLVAAASSTSTSTSTSRKHGQQQLKAAELPKLMTNGSQVGVRLDSAAGRKLARMQTKRQLTGSQQEASSRRNQDPWFLDQPAYPLQPYRFVYNVKGQDGQTEQYRQEVGDGKYLTGSYGYVLPDGIYRHVDYVADERGFRAFIRTSEPGTANQNPADVVINARPVSVASPGVSYAPSGPLADGPTASQPLYQPSQWFDYLNARQRANSYASQTSGRPLAALPAGSIVTNNSLRPPNATSFIFNPLWPSSVQSTPILAPNVAQFNGPSGGVGPAEVTAGGPAQRSGYASNFEQQQQLAGPVAHLNRDSISFGARNLTTDTDWPGHSASKTDWRPPPIPSNSLQARSLEAALQRGSLAASNRKWGPSVIAYDSPLGRFQANGFGSGPAKIDYDLAHLAGRANTAAPDSPATQMSANFGPLDELTRADLARGQLLGQLEPIRPLDADSLLAKHRANLIANVQATLKPIEPPRVSSTAAQDSHHSIHLESSHRHESSDHHEHHQQVQRHQVYRLKPGDGQSSPKLELVSSREQVSASKTGGGREVELHQQQSLAEPPAPSFAGISGPPSGIQLRPDELEGDLKKVGPSQTEERTETGKSAGKLLLKAPYVGPAAGAHKTVQLQQEAEPANSPSQTNSGAKNQIRGPGDSEEERTEQSGSPKTSSESPVAQAGAKGAASSRQTGEQRPSRHLSWLATSQHGVRSVRMNPDEPKSVSLRAMMSGVKSMQSHLGLPQPPRLAKRPIGETVQELRQLTGSRGPSSGGSSSGDAPDLRRLADSPAEADGSAKLKQQLLTQKPVANEPIGVPVSGPFASSSSPNVSSHLSTGPVIRREEPLVLLLPSQAEEEEASLIAGRLNSSSIFDARRLAAAPSKRPSEKAPSELEKFQQRLRAQQLLLEQQAKNKHDIESNLIGPATLATADRQPGLAETSKSKSAVTGLNSQVRYDEELERPSSSGNSWRQAAKTSNEAQRATANGTTNSDSLPLVVEAKRRQLTVVQLPASKSTAGDGNSSQAQRAGQLSEFARQLQNWPSLSKMPANVSTSQQVTPIDLNFINSVTALSVDTLNPFALQSVNPSLDREGRNAASIGNGSGGGPSVATARYASSPELLAAQRHHEASETRSKLLRALEASPGGARSDVSSVWASNHQPFPVSEADSTSFIPISQRHSNPKQSLIQNEPANHRFFEVASATGDLAAFTNEAYTDAQLSVRALASRRRRRQTDRLSQI